MAKYKHTDMEDGQGLFLSINLKEQLLPGTFEYMLDKLIGDKIDISTFDSNYNNDKTGAAAVPPSALVKLIIYGYSKGKNSSRGLWELGRDNMVAKALTYNMEPHWTTIAGFISGNGERFKEVFAKVLAYCVELDLVEGKTFAIDGLRLPSNASLELTGTAEELGKRLKVYRRMAEKHMEKHNRRDRAGKADGETRRHFEERQKKLNMKIEKINGFLETMEKRESGRGKEMKSNVTDNESAMTRTSKGYIQGYIGIAVSDQKERIIVSSEAVGSANECEHFPGMLDETMENMKQAKLKASEGSRVTILADKNYYSEENLKVCNDRGINVIIPDSQYRSRLGKDGEKRYEETDFSYHEEGNYYECPCGKRLEYKGDSTLPGGRKWKVYRASVKDCRLCPDKGKCIRNAEKDVKRAKGRSLPVREKKEGGELCRRMREKLDTVECQDEYAYRIQIIEPVFANIANSKRLNRFTLRGKAKVNAQWRLYCIVHNLGKCLKAFNIA